MTPSTRLGRAAVTLLLVFAAASALFDNPWLAVSSLSAAIAAITGGAVAVVAIAGCRERAALVAAAALVGLLVALWVSQEIAVAHSIP